MKDNWPPDATDYCPICEQYIYNGKEHKHSVEPNPLAVWVKLKRETIGHSIGGVHSVCCKAGVIDFYLDSYVRCTACKEICQTEPAIPKGTPIQVAYTTREVNAEFFVDAKREYECAVKNPILIKYFGRLGAAIHINPATLVR